MEHIVGVDLHSDNGYYGIIEPDGKRVFKKFHYPPNIDVVIYNSDSAKVKRFAIECKFTEAYSTHGSHGLKPKYLDIDSIWYDIPQIHNCKIIQ